MDNSGDIKLFNDNGTDVALPSIEETSENTLASEDISDSILSDTVTALRIPEETDIPLVNYVIDVSNLQSITVFQKVAIKSILSENGDVPMFFYNDKGLTYFGSGSKYKLDMMISSLKQDIFMDEDIHIYKDVQPGQELKEVVGKDITKWRLNL